MTLPTHCQQPSAHILARLTFFLQNPERLAFCLIHQEPVAGGTLLEDQRQRERAPQKAQQAALGGKHFRIQEIKILHFRQ